MTKTIDRFAWDPDGALVNDEDGEYCRYQDVADEIERLTQERDEWASKWHRIRAELAELKYPGMKGVIRPLASASDEPNDTVALTELAAALRPIIERDEQREMPTTGLENAAREIEWAARRDRPTGSNERPMTLGRLMLETARGTVKERTVTGKELAEIRANMTRYFKGPLHFREPVDESGAPYIYDANGNAVAMLMWPGHPVEETAAAEQATYAMGRAMAAVIDGGEASAARELTLQDFGYAPGNYGINCLDCGQESLWCDKRAIRCETCAKQAMAENRKDISERTKGNQ